MDWHATRKRITNGPARRRREERGRWLAEVFPDLDQMTVLDLGGRVLTWQRAPVRPKHVHCVNLLDPPKDIPDWAEAEVGDACNLPEHITSRRYDLVFSNSVIEHVGGHANRLKFAENVHSLADAHWVQTPYRYFLMEPHLMAPMVQFMPLTTRAWMARRWPLSYGRGRTTDRSLNQVLNIELLDRTHMRYYFPDSKIGVEKAFGMPKSLVAYRTGREDKPR
ncbi:MAG TPA: class I SAM-dependent methyltransferase [Streptosporangiaceae bacterium]